MLETNNHDAQIVWQTFGSLHYQNLVGSPQQISCILENILKQ